jgi:Metal binding domain of Ada
MTQPPKSYTLIGADWQPYRSLTKGAIGGHRGSKIFGRLDCPSALRAIERGGYVRHRVFFADPAIATKAGYRPCAVCQPDAYREWNDSRRADESAPSATDDGSGI